MKAALRVRMQERDARRPGALVDTYRILELFGDVAAELSRGLFSAEGRLRSYETVEFVAPVHAGDVLEVEGEILSSDPSSLTIQLEARNATQPSTQMIARARGTWVVSGER